MDLTKETIREFKKITGTDLEEFFINTAIFFSKDYNRIVAFYSGAISVIDKGPFDNFDKIETDCATIFSKYQAISGRLNNAKWWVVLDLIEQTDSRLKTLRKINKWSKSSLKGVSYHPSYQIEHITTQQQTLERVASDILGDQGDDAWFDIAVSNHLTEEGYTMKGGASLKLNLPVINNGIKVDAVIAVMQGKAIYGIDIYKKIQFLNEDLTILGYDETIEQSVDILANLKRNDNPAYPNDGLQREVVQGGTRASLNFPIIQRQFASTFATDDTLKNFTVTGIDIDADNLTMNFEVTTRLNEVTDGSATLV
jgi:hypothetical protein